MYGMTDHERELAGDGGHRAAIIQGLIDLAAFLAAHPDVPVHDDLEVLYHVFGGSDEEKRARADCIAAAMGTPAERQKNGSYRAVRAFGPVSYCALAIPAAQMAEHNALWSYQGCVRPESAVTA